jgi:hypothetical protein
MQAEIVCDVRSKYSNYSGRYSYWNRNKEDLELIILMY